jgi:hypothetical protein
MNRFFTSPAFPGSGGQFFFQSEIVENFSGWTAFVQRLWQDEGGMNDEAPMTKPCGAGGGRFPASRSPLLARLLRLGQPQPT